MDSIGPGIVGAEEDCDSGTHAHYRHRPRKARLGVSNYHFRRLREALTGIRPDGVAVVTRRHRRVTTQIRRLARVFAIAFARNHIAGRSGLLLQSLSIPRLTVANGNEVRPWLRAGFAAD